MDIGEPNLTYPSWQWKQVNCGPSYDTNALQRTDCDSWATNKKFRIFVIGHLTTLFIPNHCCSREQVFKRGQFFIGWFCFLSVAEMEVTRDDTSQSLSMALKQKDSKIGLLTQNLQQQEGENMAMEAKLVFRSMKRERENKLDPWGNRRKSPRESIPYPSGNRSGALCPTILALWALYLSLFHHRMQNSPSFFILHRSYNFVLILSTNNAPSKLSTWDVFFFRMEGDFNRGRISSLGRVLDCRAGGRGPDQ